MADNRNFAALDWLVHEIGETLKEARQSLESYVENPKDVARIRFCLTHIHQVHGSLQMVEFYGAAMLANEMEQLTQAMIAGEVTNIEEAQEVLMRAILQFPLYLDQVKSTRKDNPLVVLPLLNDLRAVRGEHLLTDTKLFIPNLAPAKKISGARLPVTHDNMQFQAMVLKLRQMYQYAASGFTRDINPEENLAYLQKAFSRLHKLTQGTARFALWDICLALLEALEIDAIEISVAIKDLLRQLDKEIKILAVHGTKALHSFTNDELIKNLLYYVARAGKQASALPAHSHIQRIYQAYALEEALLEGKEASEDSAPTMLTAPDSEAMRSVVTALKDELSIIKTALDTCLAGGDTQATLSEALPIIKRVADTLAILGLGDLRQRVLEQGGALELIVDSDSRMTDDQLMAVASQIITIENSLDNLLEPSGSTQTLDETNITLTRAKESVLRESRNGLEHAKDAIIEYIASQWNRSHLHSVPDTLREIRGGLDIMPLPRPARILGACARYIDEQLLQEAITPEWATLDTLADAITSVEYYLERLSSGSQRDEDELLLGVAEESVAALGYSVSKLSRPSSYLDKSQANLDKDQANDTDPRPSDHAAHEDDVSTLENIYAAMASTDGELNPDGELNLDEEPSPDDALSQLEAAYAQSLPLLDDRISTDSTETALQPPPTAPVISRTDNDDIDDEIIEIFIEEATEVTETIAEYFPRWARNFKDDESLTEFRRAFHTLKGSGRMVGANEIGELAWSIENMLNRIIDHTVVAQPVHAAVIEQVCALLPGMIDAFQRNQPNPQAEQTETYRQHALALAQGVIPPALAGLTAPQKPEQPWADTLDELDDGDTDQAQLPVTDYAPATDEYHLPLHTDAADSIDGALESVDGALESHTNADHTIYQPDHDLDQQDTESDLVVEDGLVLEDGLELDDDLGIDNGIEIGDGLALENDHAPDSSLEDESALFAAAVEQPFSELDDTDAQLRDIFAAEALTHMQVVEHFIQRMEAEAPIYEPPSDHMQRALHTLKGSAHMAEITPVAELAAPLERFVKALRAYHLNIDDDILQLLRDGVSYTYDALAQIAANEPVDIPRLPQFLARVNELHDIHVAPLVNQQEQDKVGKRPVDPELLAIFMAEEMNLLLEADQIIARWQASPDDIAQLEPVSMELDRLTQAATHAYLPPMAELGAKLGQVYTDILARQFPCSDDLCQTLTMAHTALLDMVDAIAAGQNLQPIPEAINSALHSILNDQDEVITLTTLAYDNEEPQAEASADTFTLDEADLDETASEEPASEATALETAIDTTLETTAPEEIAPEETVPEETAPGAAALEELTLEGITSDQALTETAPIEDFDAEIVEIFIEEAHELLEDIDRSLHDWQGDWSNSECAEALKRSLHTFKGGARLAGMTDLGDLSHDFETLLIETDTEGELDQAFFDRLNNYQDRMHAGVARVNARLNGSAPATPTAAPATPIATPASNTPTQSPIETMGPTDAFINDDEVTVDDVINQLRYVGSASDAEPSANHNTKSSAEHDDQPLDNESPQADEHLRVVVDNTDAHASQTSGLTPVPSAPAPLSTEKPNILTFAPKAKPSAPSLPNIPGTEYGGLRAGTGAGTNTGGAQVQHLAARRSGPQEVVKVSAELLEQLVNLAGETSISRGRMEQQVSDLSNSIEEMDATIHRLQEQLRRLDIETEAQVLFRQEQMMQHEEFDPLEMDRYSQLQQLSRSLIESASDLMDLKYTLADKTRDAETLLLQQSRINTDLQEGLMRSRMVPFSRLVPRLRRIVRQAATELGKEVEFELDNVEGEMDRTVLERMIAPLEHMLRNAVDHGIETPEERQQLGKPDNGRILLTLGREGGDVILRLIDDGRGINLKRVREKAIERGLMAADAHLSDQDVMQFILHAGFSTAEKITQISGRGVGMDVVHSEIKQLGGAMFIDSRSGEGTQFTIRLPFTVSVNRALMVQIGDDLYAIPLNTIEGIVRVSPFELEHYYQDNEARFDYAGEEYLVRYLGTMLDSASQPKLDGQALPLPVVLVRSAEHTVALQVDRLLGSREIVVKTLGAQFSAVRGVSGATVMGDGSVVVILDLHALIREQLALGLHNTVLLEAFTHPTAPDEGQTEQTVMVVDDSVTVRKVTGRFLEREGFRVITAKDGVEALQLLQDHLPDVILLDIEMPRMDGFEVAKNIRTSSRLKDIPIIMITSRTGGKHRERAFSLGVDKYMGKPYQEDLLLSNIRELLSQIAN